eukprot:scaffold74750_cov48-Prasinocladus_malaysianus.AAC.1
MIQDSRDLLPSNSSNQPTLPLIRLKRFGQKFVNKVANPQDILLFAKQAQRKSQGANQANKLSAEELDMLRPEQLDQTRIEDLIAENLGPGEPLQILVEEDLRTALHDYVEKDEKQALDAC